MNDAIGGYFGLEIPPGVSPYPTALGYNSARYAFQALLGTSNARRLYLPWYTCKTMVEAAHRSGIELRRYCLDERLEPVGLPALDADERLLYVNYFGYQGAFIRERLAPSLAGQLIADHAQALFCPPLDGVPTLYSPRKFVGVPDGGWLLNAPAIMPPLPPALSKDRFAALLGRLEDGPEPWYGSYVEVEQGIAAEGMRGMSVLTARLLEGVDYAGIAARRQANLAHLHRGLAGLNRYQVPVQAGLAPLCYPLLLADASQTERVRAQLAGQRIYLATYWRDVLEAKGGCEVGARWAQCMLPLPIDQRYGPAHMERLIAAVSQALG
ncbi:hypothetical protein [Pseudomonas sp. RIT-PI-S]|uniref:hypothetical protein n=1 Tax=Pseudomonas sp. RIT-PI-S TaxID=3035295 RepID=UPI0021D9D1BE|nr:hypothetical protein [Pseudomonas sp. RIT-PI-S]